MQYNAHLKVVWLEDKYLLYSNKTRVGHFGPQRKCVGFPPAWSQPPGLVQKH